jgi:glycosyltransferase involved in cell wall biosynthesis
MNILHVTPHLGGGVGKAHAALSGALPKDVHRTFVLLEEPRDRRFADAIEARGAKVIVADSLDTIASLARSADIVQFEFWNHPRLFECLARCAFPPMRTVFWSHVSGLHRPLISPTLIEEASRFAFTTEASRSSRSVAAVSAAARENIRVINSGFGFDDAPPRAGSGRDASVIAYLGTVDFIKMHPGFFDAVDRLTGDDIRVEVWGGFDPSGPVAERVRAMRHPERIGLCGHTDDPAAALAGAGIFFYPLQRDHYGTAENALVEAMSLGLAPVVLNNLAEMAIVHHGDTGLVADSIDGCVGALQTLLSSPVLRRHLSECASRHVAETRTPAATARELMTLWLGLLGEPARAHDFSDAIGATPAEWFLTTQRLPGEPWHEHGRVQSHQPSKGMLTHFLSAFPGDAALSHLAETGYAPAEVAVTAARARQMR